MDVMDSQTDNVNGSQQLILKQIEDSALVVANRKDLYFKKGDDPLSYANTSDYFYFIMSGKIKIYHIDLTSAKEQILYLLAYGDMFDVVSLLDKQPNDYLSEVLEDAHIIQVPLRDVEAMILEDARFRQYFYTYLAQQLKSMEALAVSLSFYDVYQRVLQLFARFTEVIDGKSRLKVIDNLNHEDLASMIGTVRKVLNRSLQRLKHDGIIDISRKKIHIKNFQKLLEQLNV